jgi:hypothetical protein
VKSNVADCHPKALADQRENLTSAWACEIFALDVFLFAVVRIPDKLASADHGYRLRKILYFKEWIWSARHNKIPEGLK